MQDVQPPVVAGQAADIFASTSQVTSQLKVLATLAVSKRLRISLNAWRGKRLVVVTAELSGRACDG
jgi:hypothetical protein